MSNSNGRTRPPTSDRVALLVSSSDRTIDVFEKVFSNFGTAWPDCPYPRYVGATCVAPEANHGFGPLLAAGEQGWAKELSLQLDQLPASIEYVILLLDDFLLQGRVETALVEQAVELSTKGRLPYLRLRPLERSVWISAYRRLAHGLGPLRALRVRRNENYYSALQAAIWDRKHLQQCLRESGSIWDFEHMVPQPEHYAVSRRVLFYRHVVQKGEWRGYAPRYFRREGLLFDAGSRLLRPAADDRLFQLERIRFGLMGYAGPRLKAWLRKTPS